jgi:hypothetical protein
LITALWVPVFAGTAANSAYAAPHLSFRTRKKMADNLFATAKVLNDLSAKRCIRDGRAFYSPSVLFYFFFDYFALLKEKIQADFMP